MTTEQDTNHLQLLSTFHYVVAGILALFSMFPIIHLAMGIAIVTGTFDQAGQGEEVPDFFGWILVIFPAMIILCGLVMAVAVANAGRHLAHCTRYTYCLIVAGIECIFMPFGTILGVFTIVVLTRPSVKELFDVE